MKTLYALVLLCLSAPALAWEPEAYNIACPEDGLTLSAIVPATQNYDYSVDTSIDYDDHTATVASPASQPTTDAPVDPIINFFDDEGVDFTVPAAIEDAIQASDWW